MTEPVRSFSAVPGRTDPDLDGPVATPLDALREELSEQLDGSELTLTVPSRPGYELRCSSGVRYEQIAAWRKAASDRAMPGGLNELRFASILVANQTQAVLRQSEEVITPDGPLTFRSTELHSILGVDRAADAVRKFFGRDADVVKASQSILRAAGFDGGDLDADPTEL